MVNWRAINAKIGIVNGAIERVLSALAGNRFAPLGVILLAAVVRVTRFWRDPLISRDGAFYIELARRWISDGRLSVWNPVESGEVLAAPLYLLVLKLAMLAKLDAALCGAYFNLACSVLTVLLVYLLARELFADRRWAVFAAFACCWQPILVRQSYEVMRESIYLVCWLGSLYFFVRTLRERKETAPLLRRVCRLALSAVLLAAAFLGRFEALDLLPALLVFLAVRGIAAKRREKSGGTWKAVLVDGLFYLLCFGVALFLLCRACDFSLVEMLKMFLRTAESRYAAGGAH